MITIGLDVHVRNSFLHARDPEGRVLVQGRCGNTLGELAQKLAPVERAARQRGEPVRAVLESTTNSRPMALLLERYGQEAGIDLTAQVLDARKLAIIASSVCKCDKLDAGVLDELAGSNLRLPVCYMPDDQVFALREHLRGRADLVRVRTMMKNRCHALLHRRGVLRPAGLDAFTGSGRAWLAQLELDGAGRVILDRLLALVDQFDAALKQSQQDLRELARRQRWSGPVALLATMPGVGLITALTILAELGDVDRFRGRDAVANYAGLVPVVRSSNEKMYHGGITHRGPCHLRGALVEAAWIGQAKAPAYAALYERVKTKSCAQKAIVAVARRMLEDAWTMLKKGQAFRYAPGNPASPGIRGAKRPSPPEGIEANEARAAG
jgi:transposase